MPQLTLEDVLPMVRDLAARKANAFTRRCGLPISTRCDVQSELVLRFLTRWPKFDERKSSIRTFASRVMDHELASIWRSQVAQCRQAKSLPEVAVSPSAAVLRQFRLDVSRAIAALPRETRETAFALSELSTRESADALDCSRQTITRRKREIREALRSAGIGPDYFARQGPQDGARHGRHCAVLPPRGADRPQW
jgi:RNA polymerase sigma factor (sigma-70 family)